MGVRAIAQDLGVRYLLEGSARRAAGRVCINAQLIDAVSGDHLWAERFDRSLEDIFAVQDEVTAKIVEALLGRLRASPPPAPTSRWWRWAAWCAAIPAITSRSPTVAPKA
jgi:hypothetical protein